MQSLLVLTPQVPYPPKQGTALRNWGLLRSLAEQYKVSLLSFYADDQDAEVPAILHKLLHQVALFPQPERHISDRLRDLVFTRRPDLVLRLKSAPFAAEMKHWVERYTYDWIVVEGLEMAPYLDQIKPGATSPKVLFDDHNCEYILQQRAARTDWRKPSRWVGALYSSIQWRKLRRYESEVCNAVDTVVCVSEDDALAIKRIAPGVQPLVIPNGISFDEYAGYKTGITLQQPAFVFTGTMNFRPNVDGVIWFAQHVWPMIRQELPDAHFYVVGRHPHPRLNALAETPGMMITGGVPETRDYIHAAAVYVVPLLVGGGTRLKILESTAMAKAVVATSLGAEGFTRPEQAMILADTPDTFASACIRLAKDVQEREAWGSRASVFARSYDWANLMPVLMDRLDTLQHRPPK
ncbi:MAG: glycosyltransferase [Anaerolineae bacterium]|nr:glycosyltransferase [Anaerolineae bacterium]